MSPTFHLTILSSDKKIFEGDLVSLIAPGEVGYLGILAHHTPLITPLVPGRLTMRDSSGKTTLIENNNKGFLEVSDNKATILLCHEAS